MESATAAGHQVRIIDAGAWRPAIDVVKSQLDQLPPDLVVLSGPLEAVKNMRAYAELVKVPKIIVGDHWLLLKNDEFPLPVIGGAPETVLGEVLSKLGMEDVPRREGLVEDADLLAYPNFSWVPTEIYSTPLPYGATVEQWKLRLDVETERGGKPFSVKYLIDELTYLRMRYAMDGVRFIGHIADDTKRIIGLCEMLRETDLCLSHTWICDVTPRENELARLGRMKDNGCTAIRIPLHDAGKFKDEKLQACVQTCKAIDLPVFVEFKIGWPTDDEEGYLGAVEFCRINEIECLPVIAPPEELLPVEGYFAAEARTQFLEKPTRYPAINRSIYSNIQLLGAWHAMRMEDADSLKEL